MTGITAQIETTDSETVTIEQKYFQALASMRDKDNTAINAVTPYARLTFNRLLNEKTAEGLAAFSIDDVQSDLGQAYGFKSTSSGKASKTLVPRAKQHYDGISLVMRNIGTEGVLALVTAFIDSETPLKSTFNGLLDDVRKAIADKAKAKAKENATEAEAEAPEAEAEAPATATPMDTSTVLASMAAYIDGLTVDDIAANDDGLAAIMAAVSAAYAKATATPMAEAA